MDLSKRLHTVACAVTPGNRVVDVGTDHAYVPIWLAEQGLIPSAIASDVGEGPLKRAQDHIREKKLEDRICTRLGSGLDPVSPEEADTVIMAGMGGDLISRLLEAGKTFFRYKKEFILQPQSEWFKVRHVLHKYGYRIDREWMLFEGGHYYVVMRGLPGDEKYDSETEYQYGRYLLSHRDPTLIRYLTEEYRKKNAILLRLIEKEDRKDLNCSWKDQAGGKDDSRRAGAIRDRIRQLQSETDRIRQYLSENKRLEDSEPDDKPGSVVNDHLSGPAVAGRFRRPT